MTGAVIHVALSVFCILGLVLELFIQQDKYVPELTEEAGEYYIGLTCCKMH